MLISSITEKQGLLNRYILIFIIIYHDTGEKINKKKKKLQHNNSYIVLIKIYNTNVFWQ